MRSALNAVPRTTHRVRKRFGSQLSMRAIWVIRYW